MEELNYRLSDKRNDINGLWITRFIENKREQNRIFTIMVYLTRAEIVS